MFQQLSIITNFTLFLSIFSIVCYSQTVDISKKNTCLLQTEINGCSASVQSGCSWCSNEWGCMFTDSYDVMTQTSVHNYSCPQPCLVDDMECYRIMDKSDLKQPFFFHLSTNNNKNIVCHLQHTYEIYRLHSFHCDESCRKALMSDFGYCQFYDDDGKEFKDYKLYGNTSKKGLSTVMILIIIASAIAVLAIILLLFSIYIKKHNKVLEERKKLELEDTKLENDRNLEAQIDQINGRAYNDRSFLTSN